MCTSDLYLDRRCDLNYVHVIIIGEPPYGNHPRAREPRGRDALKLWRPHFPKRAS